MRLSKREKAALRAALQEGASADWEKLRARLPAHPPAQLPAHPHAETGAGAIRKRYRHAPVAAAVAVAAVIAVSVTLYAWPGRVPKYNGQPVYASAIPPVKAISEQKAVSIAVEANQKALNTGTLSQAEKDALGNLSQLPCRTRYVANCLPSDHAIWSIAFDDTANKRIHSVAVDAYTGECDETANMSADEEREIQNGLSSGEVMPATVSVGQGPMADQNPANMSLVAYGWDGLAVLFAQGSLKEMQSYTSFPDAVKQYLSASDDTASTSGQAASSEVSSAAGDYKLTVTLQDNSAKTGTSSQVRPGARDLTMEQAAQVMAQDIHDLFGADVQNSVVKMVYDYHASDNTAGWLAYITLPDKTTHFNCRINSITGQVTDIGISLTDPKTGVTIGPSSDKPDAAKVKALKADPALLQAAKDFVQNKLHQQVTAAKIGDVDRSYLGTGYCVRVNVALPDGSGYGIDLQDDSTFLGFQFLPKGTTGIPSAN